ncbi:MAG: hypothetical protein EPN25_13930 [Nitrospirae bacterium]|nr:MAG: hypothetical protein EPN25_13930 [Nitrospirota bacterium]
MKARRMIRSFIWVVVVVACLFLSSVAQASDYLGQFCWQSSVDGSIYVFAVNDMGNFHYLLNGRVILPGGSILPLSGSAEAGQQGDNTAVYVSLNGGLFGSSLTESFSLNWALNLSTLNGTGAGIMIGSNYQGQSTIAVIQDTLNFVFCP